MKLFELVKRWQGKGCNCGDELLETLISTAEGEAEDECYPYICEVLGLPADYKTLR